MKTALPGWALEEKLSARSTARGSVIAIGSGVARLSASLLGALVLARYLSPEDFGLVAIAMPIVLVMGALSDGGVSTHTLQAKSLTRQGLSLSFYLASLVGVISVFLTIFSGILLSLIFDDSRLVPILFALAFAVFMSSLGSQHNALAKRYHRQDLYGLAEIIAAVCSLISAVYIAKSGGEYWALVAIPLVRQAVHTVVMWCATGWVPSIVSYDHHVAKSIMSFSSFIILSQLVNILGKSVDKWILGYHASAEELGYYAMAVSIMMLPSMQLLSPVAGAVIPYLSRVYHQKPRDLSAEYNRINFILLSVVLPGMLWASLNSEFLIVLVLGEKWLNTAEVFSVLAIASVLMMQLSVVGWLFTSIGKSKVLSNISIFSLVSLSILSLFFAKYGALYMAFAVLANYAIASCVFLAALVFYGGVGVTFANSMPVTIIVAVVSVVIVYGVDYLVNLFETGGGAIFVLLTLSITGSVSMLSFFVGYRYLKKNIWDI